jgi:outer membrane beta-barrel protein
MRWPATRKHLLWIMALVVFGAVPPAQASGGGENLQPYSSLVVQNRKHNPTHEIGLALGTLPLDAFTKGVTLSGGYTLHLSELYAWEVVQFAYSFHVDTNLKAELAAYDTPLRPTPFEVLDYYVTSNFVFKPLYWKGSWLNASLTHGELFLTLGGAYAWYTRSARPGASVGGGARLFVSELFSVRLDLRYLAFFDDTFLEQYSVKDELFIGLGASIGF